MFSDGYADQRGGPGKKRIGYVKFKEFLENSSHVSIDEQKTEMENYLMSWKGNLDQIDDILLLGVEI